MRESDNDTVGILDDDCELTMEKQSIVKEIRGKIKNFI